MNIHLIIFFVFVIWIKHIHTADATQEVESNTKWLVDNFLRRSNDRKPPKIYLLGWGSFGRKLPEMLPDVVLIGPGLFGKSGRGEGNIKHKKLKKNIKLRHKHRKNHGKRPGPKPPKPTKPPNRPQSSKTTKSPKWVIDSSHQVNVEIRVVDEQATTTDDDRIY